MNTTDKLHIVYSYLLDVYFKEILASLQMHGLLHLLDVRAHVITLVGRRHLVLTRTVRHVP